MARQLALTFPRVRRRGRGGPRDGAGRPKTTDETVPHERRPPLSGREPVHVTMRVRRDVWNLRSQRGFRAIERALVAEKAKGHLRVVHYSVQGNHVHLVAEADDMPTLSRRMQGFGIRLAKALNAMMQRRRGRVFAERYHLRVLRTPTQVRNAIRYVLRNATKHHGRTGVDPYSSAPWFDGWSTHVPLSRSTPCTGPPPIVAATTWLLGHGWRRLGLLDP